MNLAIFSNSSRILIMTFAPPSTVYFCTEVLKNDFELFYEALPQRQAQYMLTQCGDRSLL
jgi:hypothetical protein